MTQHPCHSSDRFNLLGLQNAPSKYKCSRCAEQETGALQTIAERKKEKNKGVAVEFSLQSIYVRLEQGRITVVWGTTTRGD